MTTDDGRPESWLTPLRGDALAYLASAGFAICLWADSNLSAHRDWSRDAIGGYVAAGAVGLALSWRRPREELRVRAWLAVACGVLVALVPLCLMVAARSGTTSEDHVLPETAVIQRAGDRLAHGRDPYVANLVHGRLVGRVAGVPRYEAFFPYFPLMAAFGLPSAFGIGPLGDARWYFAGVTLLAAAAALWLARAPPARALRVAQVLFVLPTGALFLAAGGDDLPVLALSLLGAVLIHRRRDLEGGAVFGVVMAMKLTAWPLAMLCLLVIALRDSVRAALRALAVLVGVVVVVLVPFFAWGPRTFLVNTIAFPLGLSGVNSPAASPLPGHVLVTLLPAAQKVLLVGLAVVGTPVLAWWLWRRPPRTVPAACRLAAVLTIIVMCTAPATRVGYVVYPVNFLLWGWLLAASEDGRQPAHMTLSTWKSRKV